MNLSEKKERVAMVVRDIDFEQIPVYIINYADKRSNKAGGYVILVGDKRINKASNILAYSDTGSWGNEEPLLENFLDLFWGNVDGLIRNELAISSSNSKNSRNSFGHSQCQHCLQFSIHYHYDDAKRLSQPALWNQYDPYNAKLAPVCSPLPIGLSLYYPVGCVAVAMGQIMAYHRKPASGSYVNYLGTTVNTTYNWTTMTTSQHIGLLSLTGREMVQNLLAEIGQKVSMIYSCLNSGASMTSARAGFAAMTYTTAPLEIDFDYGAVAFEIASNRPVLAYGRANLSPLFRNHAWVMDGVNSQKVVEEVYWECPWIGGMELLYTITSYVNYVYCNLGAAVPGGLSGYYNSNLFKNYFNSDTIILINIR